MRGTIRYNFSRIPIRETGKPKFLEVRYELQTIRQ
ncbi:hypothetical protein CLOLEP_01242 [[Clostridium] leptum DSM 753]|uniref:Uncharacterized protein n=1 Tax=[Clostridium] leptum DSM 753 TaxID=428125 RepID=A7VRQ8_9FIRM|nr:hypothetical protein CLOLEP_01242 [[Clostridium] leptum DSM 753]